MVEFLIDIKGKEFSYKKGKRYCSLSDSKEGELEDKILVRQPNSPKKKNWWTIFSKSDEGTAFRTLSDDEKSLSEKAEENKILQY